MSELTIIVLNWNNSESTLRCLQSYADLNGGPYKTIVVDNGSSDDSCAIIGQQNPSVEILSLSQNLGYAEGNNCGIRRALADGAEYVLITNNDVYPFDRELVNSLMAVMEKNRDVGIVGPKILTTDRQRTLFARGSFILWNKGDLYHRDMFQPEPQTLIAEKTESVDFIIGCCLLVSRRFIEKVGYLDPEYFLNYEDVDWGLRAHRQGFDVIYVPEAVVRHEVSATLGMSSPANTYYMTRNALRFFRLNSSPHLKYFATVRILLRTFRTVVAWSIWSEYRNESFRRKRKANLFAVRDFFRNRFGKMGQDVTETCYPSF